ncbi:MAG: hypothetical protein A3G26_00105 [Betaproteobacteria bacterium RIFCSPLOWO2_12_FULL_65_110]|nr:MAG: hypothetical protein A3G26_00105 [Betaproteobacteria bacterium RIFCSPLOWO2_12_FULL_65_110]
MEILLLLFFMSILLASVSYGKYARLFPASMSVVGIALTLWQWFGDRKSASTRKGEGSDIGMLLRVTSWMVLFLVLLWLLPYIWALGGFTFSMLMWEAKLNVKHSILLTAITSSFIYVVFNLVLRVHLE